MQKLKENIELPEEDLEESSDSSNDSDEISGDDEGEETEINILAFDMDNTLVEFDQPGVVYTGFSLERWQKFFQTLELIGKMKNITFIFASVTFKCIDNHYEERAKKNQNNPIMNLNVYLQDTQKSIMDKEVGDEISRDILSNFTRFIKPQEVYFTQRQPKSEALIKLAREYKIPHKQISMFDDKEHVISEIQKKGFNGYLIPSEMYDLLFPKQIRENACVKWMLETLYKFGAPRLEDLQTKSQQEGSLKLHETQFLTFLSLINRSVLSNSLEEKSSVDSSISFSIQSHRNSQQDQVETDDDYIVIDNMSSETPEEGKEIRKKLMTSTATVATFKDSSYSFGPIIGGLTIKPLYFSSSASSGSSSTFSERSFSTPSQFITIEQFFIKELTNFISLAKKDQSDDIANAKALLGMSGLRLKDSILLLLKTGSFPGAMKTIRKDVSRNFLDLISENSLQKKMADAIINDESSGLLKQETQLVEAAANLISIFGH